MLFQKLKNNKGFTLIEIAIVFAIILILITIGFSVSIKTTTETVTEMVVDENTQPVPERKEVNKQKEGMSKL